MPTTYIAVTSPTRPGKGSGGMASNGEATNTGSGGIPAIVLEPVQVIGLAPLEDCTATECREITERDCCWVLPVFGDTTVDRTISTYENDISTFIVDVQIYKANPSVTTAIYLQECTTEYPTEQSWANVGSALTNNTYGTNIALNSIASHPYYRGYILNWGRVLALQGAGTYRLKIIVTWDGNEYCVVSPAYKLRAFDCKLADQTVKFDVQINGKIGAHRPQGRVFDVCGYDYKDSIRLPGFFGYERINEYLEQYNEYQNGQLTQVKNEAVQGFSFYSKYWPKEYHDRLKVYGLMADQLRVSDYNLNNSDYNIKQLRIVRSGNYQPEYADKNRYRMAKVQVEFKAGVQNIIKSLCCPVK